MVFSVHIVLLLGEELVRTIGLDLTILYMHSDKIRDLTVKLDGSYEDSTHIHTFTIETMLIFKNVYSYSKQITLILGIKNDAKFTVAEIRSNPKNIK